MTKHSFYHDPCASFTNEQLSLPKVAALWSDKLVILDPVGASWATIGTDHHAREIVKQLQDTRMVPEFGPPASRGVL